MFGSEKIGQRRMVIPDANSSIAKGLQVRPGCALPRSPITKSDNWTQWARTYGFSLRDIVRILAAEAITRRWSILAPGQEIEITFTTMMRDCALQNEKHHLRASFPNLERPLAGKRYLVA